MSYMARISTLKGTNLVGCVLSVLIFLVGGSTVAQEPQEELRDQINNIVLWETAIRDRRAQQFEATQRKREARRKKISENPKTDLPAAPPIELLEPWVFEPTLERRARENKWPDVFQEQIKKIGSLGEYSHKVMWFKHVSQNYAAIAEIEQKENWLFNLSRGLQQKLKRLDKLSGVQRKVLAKDIRHQAALAERIVCTIANCAWPEPKPQKKAAPQPVQPRLPGKVELPSVRQASGSADKALQKAKKPKLKMMTGFASGLLYQIGLHHERLEFKARDMDANRKKMAAKKAAGDGKAGGGGVTLHSPAIIEGGLDPAGVERAGVMDGRLVLMMRDGRQVLMPEMPLDDLAVAIRTIYGPSGTLKGTLEAVDGAAIVYKTGPKQFGDVVWRKSYLPQPWTVQKIGKTIGLAIGPAVGILPLPEPSASRVTYYGDIKNTRIGWVISEADHLLSFFLTGVDRKTGKLSRLPNVPGFMSSIELQARVKTGMIKLPPWNPAPKSNPNDPYAKSWWRGGTFYVWVPDSVRFRYVPARKEVVPVEIGMKLEAWTAHLRGSQPFELASADFVSKNFKQLARHYSILNDLNDVLATVSIVRWLKTNNIPVDLQWAKKRKLVAVKTPERTEDVWTGLVNGRDGKPVFRKTGAAQK